MRNILAAVLLFFLYAGRLTAQEEVLFTMDGIPVTVQEFERAYSKNGNIPGIDIPADEYLERYINFRLKVLEAERMGYDTLQAFVDELEGYREQLVRPYLQDAQAVERLIREAYDRTVTEVNVSQILLLLPENASPQDTINQYLKAMDVRDRLLSGEAFAAVAAETSDDPSVIYNHGDVGWFGAFTMVFPFEDAAYNTPVGEISLPVRTTYGYHILRVNGRRDALGEIRLAHIMVRAAINEGDSVSEAALKKIRTCLDLIEKGEEFGDVARQFSEDASSATENGRMRWIRSAELPPDIEEVVFAMEDSGSMTRPLRSAYGWHVFQLLEKRPVATFEELEPQLREKVLSDERIYAVEEAFSDREDSLELAHPGFLDLMQEYHDGILLFNISEDRVWQRAVEDTAGLTAFYLQHQADYMQPEQVMVLIYTVPDSTTVRRIRKIAARGARRDKPADEVMHSICRDDVSCPVQVEQAGFERGENTFIDGMKWKKGSWKVQRQDTAYRVHVVSDVLPPFQKNLAEVRGTVMADYQDYLDAQWVKELREKYPVDIREEGLMKVLDGHMEGDEVAR